MIGGHDPMAMPAPPQIMLFLLGLTFVLHFGLLGLLFSSLWARAAAEWGKLGAYDSQRVHRAGVVGFSMTITLGVPPLLFVQILYGKYFYTSSISIGFPWLAIVAYLLIGFYALYWTVWSWMRNNGPSLSGKLFWFVTVLSVIAIGYTYSWNHLKSISETPWSQNVPVVAVFHRLLGYFGAALIAASAWTFWLGPKWRTDRQVPQGAAWAAILGGLGLLTWFLTANFGRSGIYNFDGPLVSALGVVAGLIWLMAKRLNLARWLATVAALLSILELLIQREAYRLETMSPYFSPFKEQVRTQWGTLVMFALALVLGLLVLLWLLIQIRRAPSTRGSEN